MVIRTGSATDSAAGESRQIGSPVEVIDARDGRGAARDVRPIIDRLLAGIPAGYLSGLRYVVLRDAGGLGRRERRRKTRARGRVVEIVRCRGLYCQERPGRPARIELFVDNTLRGWPGWLMWIPFFQDLVVSDTLFHEVGHHIDRRIAPRHGEREDTAEGWRRRLGKMYFRRRYWYLIPILWPIVKLRRLVARQRRGRRRHAAVRRA